MVASLLAVGTLLGLLATFTLLWLPSRRSLDPSYVDTAWAYAGAAVALPALAVAVVTGEGDGARSVVLTLGAALWGARLGTHLLLRWRRSGPDPRYAALVRHWSRGPAGPTGVPQLLLRRVFWLQAALLTVVTLPVTVGQVLGPAGTGLSPLGTVGAVLVVGGLALEAVADEQLRRFRRDHAAATHDAPRPLLTTGVWSWSRHPNYAGEALAWWGLGLVAVASPAGLVVLAGPALLTWLLLTRSGIGPVEHRLRRTRPGYADYAARTSAFLPRPPRAPRPDRPAPTREPA